MAVPNLVGLLILAGTVAAIPENAYRSSKTGRILKNMVKYKRLL